MIAGGVYAFGLGDVVYASGDKGFALPSPGQWFQPGSLDMWCGMAVNVLIIGMMVWINRHYNVLRSITMLYVGLYAMMMLSVPDLTVQLYSGSLIALMLLFCCSLMYDCFDRRGPLTCRKVFMVFCLLSTGVAMQYACVVFVPVFVIACAQMRIFSLKSMVSAVLGLLTPWILLLGSGIVKPDQLHMPVIVSVFQGPYAFDALMMLASVVVTVALMLTGMALSFFKILTYNARRRAFNGVITLLSVFTLIAMMVDYTNLLTYIPTLCVCASLWGAHMLSIHRAERTYLVLAAIYLVYIGLFIWRVSV